MLGVSSVATGVWRQSSDRICCVAVLLLVRVDGDDDNSSAKCMECSHTMYQRHWKYLAYCSLLTAARERGSLTSPISQLRNRGMQIKCPEEDTELMKLGSLTPKPGP